MKTAQKILNTCLSPEEHGAIKFSVLYKTEVLLFLIVSCLQGTM